MTSGPEAGPAEVAEALRQGIAPSALVTEEPAAEVPANDVPAADAATDGPPPVPGSPGRTVAAGGVTVRITGGAIGASEEVFGDLAGSDVAAALAAQDAGLWGPAATAEASVRLGWLDAPTSSRPLIDRISTLGVICAPRGWTTSSWPEWAGPRWRRRSSPAPPA